MKKVLIGYQGWVSEIRNPGEEYEIYEGPDATIAWVDAPDEITLDWTLEWSPSKQEMVWVEREAPHTSNNVARKVAYGEVGAQLGMIFDALKENGTLDQNSDWFKHQVAVKELIPKQEEDEFTMTMEEYMKMCATTDPSPSRRPVPSTMDMPAWVRYPRWKGYKGR